MKSSPSWLAAIALALWMPALCSAASYTVIDLGTLGGGASAGLGINSSGQVTGFALTTGNAAQHAFLYDGTMHDLGTLEGQINSAGIGINASGQVTGAADSGAFLYDGTMHALGGPYSGGQGINDSGQVTGINGDHAFLYDGTMYDLGTLGGTNSNAFGINASGQVTGHSFTTGNAALHAFLYDGTMYDLGGTNSTGRGINASGQVTGDSDGHAFLYDGTMLDLGTLEGHSNSRGLGINASGHVTGESYINFGAGNITRAFLYSSESGMVDLNSLIDPLSGWILTTGSAINDAGQITGYGSISGETHAFLLTPVPEPSSLVMATMMLAIVAGATLLRRRRRARPLEAR